jgi:hypothetical protein
MSKLFSLKTSIALSLPLTVGLAVSTPVEANPPIFFAHPYHHFHGGWGWGGAGLALGLIGGAIAADIAARSCTRYRPIYDEDGNYLGRQAVNVCE